MTLKEHLETHPFYIIISIAVAVASVTYKTVDILLIQPRDQIVFKLEKELSSLKGRGMVNNYPASFPEKEISIINNANGKNPSINSVGNGATHIQNYSEVRQ